MQQMTSPYVQMSPDAARRRVGRIVIYSIISIITLAIIIMTITPVFFSARQSAERGALQDLERTAYMQGMMDASASLVPEPGEASGSTALPDIAPRIVKTGKTSLELEGGAFDGTRDQVYLIVESSGGYVQTENTSEKNGCVNGSFLLRIPFERFDETFNRIGELGRRLDMEVASQDVTQEYVDLEGRLRHMDAEERFYLEMISQARTIQDMMSIREKLSAVQLEKEQALGRKSYLESQTTYSLITLSLQEEPDPAPANVSGYWERLGGGFVSFGRACREAAVGLAYALPYLAVLALLALLAWRLFKWRAGKEARPQVTAE